MVTFLDQPVGGGTEVPMSRTVPMGPEIGAPSAVADLGVIAQPNTQMNWSQLFERLAGMEGGGSISQFMKLIQGLSPQANQQAMPTSLVATPQQGGIPSLDKGYSAKSTAQSQGGGSDSSDMQDIMDIISIFGGGA